MKTFEIYHPILGLNIMQDPNVVFEKAARVKCNTLGEVFREAQNDFNEDYALLGVRSTCVGDVVKDQETGKFFMVANIGYEEIPKIRLLEDIPIITLRVTITFGPVESE